MTEIQRKPWFRGRVETALLKGLTRAYSTVQVDHDKFLLQVRAAYRLPISSYQGVYSLDVSELDAVADSIVRSGMKIAAVEGAGFCLGGMVTIVPHLGILFALTMPNVQEPRLGFRCAVNTD